MVVKKDKSREAFNRQKLLNGMMRACEKRPVSYPDAGGRRGQYRTGAAQFLRAGDHVHSCGQAPMQELKISTK